MGFISSIFGKKPTTGSSNPAWLDAAGSDVYNRGTGIANQPYQGYTGQQVAGLTPNQQGASNYAANDVGKYNPQYGNIQSIYNNAATPYGKTYSPTAVTPDKFNIDQLTTGNNGQKITTENWDQAAADKYMNPFVMDALQPTLNKINEQSQIQQNGINATAAGAGAFGGSRQAILNAALNRDTQRNVGDYTAQGMNTAYQNAQNMFTSDQGRNLQGQIAQGNINAEDLNRLLQANTSNQTANLQGNEFMQGQNLGAQEFNQGQNADAFKTNWGVHQGDVQNALNAGHGLNDLLGTEQSGDTGNISDLLKTGLMGQETNQKQLTSNYNDFLAQRDYGKNMTSWLADLMHNSPDAHSIDPSKQTPGDNGLQSALAFGLQMAMMSDRRLKNNIVKIGAKDGINIYEFEYNDKPGKYRGVIAQEVEHVPGAVHEINGYKAVDYSKLPIAFERIA